MPARVAPSQEEEVAKAQAIPAPSLRSVTFTAFTSLPWYETRTNRKKPSPKTNHQLRGFGKGFFDSNTSAPGSTIRLRRNHQQNNRERAKSDRQLPGASAVACPVARRGRPRRHPCRQGRGPPSLASLPAPPSRGGAPAHRRVLASFRSPAHTRPPHAPQQGGPPPAGRALGPPRSGRSSDPLDLPKDT